MVFDVFGRQCLLISSFTWNRFCNCRRWRIKYKRLQSSLFTLCTWSPKCKSDIPEVFSRSAKIRAPIRCHSSYRRQCLTACNKWSWIRAAWGFVVLYFQNLETSKSAKAQKCKSAKARRKPIIKWRVFVYFVTLCNNLSKLSVLAACKKHSQWSPALQLLSDIGFCALQLDGRVARLDILTLTEQLDINTYSESHSFFRAVQDIVAFSNVITASEKCGQWTQAETRKWEWMMKLVIQVIQVIQLCKMLEMCAWC